MGKIPDRLIIAVLTTLLQEFAVAVILLLVLPRYGINTGIPVVVVILVVWTVIDTFIYLKVSKALREKPLAGLPDMVGTYGKTIEALDPTGLVQINGEIWQASSKTGKIEMGEAILVVCQDRLILVVEKKRR